MRHKKALIVLALIATVGFIATAAWAGPRGGGPWGGWGGDGPGYCANMGPQNQAFMEETADLRDELAGKRGAYQALMARENPDPERASELQREMSQIREQIRSRAQNHQAYSGNDHYGNHGYGDRGRGGRGWHGNSGGRCW
ncbi:MAG: hypothetical protein K9K62_11075 [Desulfobacteraceae bacterium]|nr:hypothetical protein [Desulfobacteraceae bacterium]